ncbi:2-C-methyl-D-erythritol 4-phosphate cytidylyltransferase, partial [Acinetobacter baumannii]
GLLALAPSPPEAILIHDAVRPFLPAALIDACLDALGTASGAIAAVPMADTVKVADADGRIAQTLDRSRLWRAQTPQAFRFPAILEAHR